jgi:response regulator RpfG family c-di-GMP phosphodiesterase
MTSKVLFVDDDVNILSSFKRRLRGRFDISAVTGGEQGLEVLEKEGPVAVVISDQRMPGMDGVEFLGEVKKLAPDTVTMMLTGNTDLTTAIEAVNQGSVFRFFTKPCRPEDMASAIETGLKQYNLVRAERDLLEQTLAGSVKVLIDVLSLLHPTAFQRTRLLRGWMLQVAKRMDLSYVWELDIAATLSPIGLITIPPEIYAKVRDGAERRRTRYLREGAGGGQESDFQYPAHEKSERNDLLSKQRFRRQWISRRLDRGQRHSIRGQAVEGVDRSRHP